MRRTLKIVLPVLLVLAMLLTSLIVFVGISGADATEATMSTQTTEHFYKNSDNEVVNVEYVTTFGTATTANGTFASLAANLATAAPTENTRYTIKLNQNVTIDTPISIVTNEYTEVLIDLNGYTLTTATAGDAITISGNGFAVRINGNYDEDGNCGKIVYAQSAGSIIKIAEGATVRTFVRNIDADLSPIPAGGAAFTALGGTLTVQNTNLTYSPSKAADITFISAENALVELKGTDITAATDGAATSTAISSTAGQVFLLDSALDAKNGVVTSGECDIMTVNSNITATAPITLDNTASTTYILGGKLKTSGTAIIAGTFDKANTVLYYGTGNTVVVGEDPLNYTIQADCSFTERASGEWVMSCSATTAAIAYNTVMGSAPTITTGTFDTCWGMLNTNKNSGTTTVTNIVTLLKDATNSRYSDASTNNEWYNRIIDFNGYTLDCSASSNFDTYGNPYIHYDGADVDGNMGTFIIRGANPMYIRTRVKSGYMGANEFTQYIFENTNILVTKTDSTSNTVNGLFTIQQGEFHMANVDYVYDGSQSTSTAERPIGIIRIGSSTSQRDAVAFINDVSFKDISTNKFMVTTPITVTYGSRNWLDNLTIDGTDYAVCSDTSSTKTVIRNSSIASVLEPYKGAGSIKLYDTVTITGASGKLSETISPVFYYGTGKTVIKSEADLVGSYSVEDGYALIMQEKGVYILMDADDIVTPSVTMPAVFQNKMVLQRNKPLNVFGYCETEGAVIEVTLAGRTATATVKDGEWCATFEPFEAMFNQTLEVRQTGNVSYNLLKFTDVNIGEVWAMTGQSNANLSTQYLEDVIEYVELAETLGNVRGYRSGNAPVLQPQKIGTGAWYDMTASVVGDAKISAIGYVAAIKIAAELGPDVPVGIMHLTRGSLKIKTMMDYETLRSVSPSAANEYDYWLSQGTLPSSSHGGNAIGTVMYNQFIAPLEGYSLAGVMWYQGEGDSGGNYFSSTKSSENYTDASGVTHTVKFREDENGNAYLEDQDNTYTEFFYALEDCFRRAFGNDDDLPFYVMQLSPFISSGYVTENLYNIKMEMYEMCKNEPNTHLVSLATDGTVVEDAFFGVLDADMSNGSTEAQGFIHPLRKSTIGIRAADMILANEYGIKHADVYTYPTPLSATFKDGKVTVTFDSELRYFYGDSVLGFEVYDGSAWVKLSGVIDGKTVVLDASALTAATRLRYGCGEALIELGDGTIIEIVNGQYSGNSTEYYITVKYNGQSYRINKNSTDMIRTMDYGNITNLSGVPMPLFGMEITEG